MTPALLAFAAAACAAVAPGADHVLARDLAAVFPPLAAVAPETEIALAPAPGVTRVFHASDLRMLATRLHVDFEIAPAAAPCVTRPVAPPDPARLLAAMQRSLPEARIEILAASRQPAPEGEIEFPASHLQRSADAGFWTGAVRYAANRRFPIWARVRVTIAARRVRAVAELRPGQPIRPEQVAVEARPDFPDAASWAESAEQVVGHWPLVGIRAGAAIRLDQLAAPQPVMRGQTVRVEVRNGAARLELEAMAESAGSVGQMVALRNPTSKRRFQARVEAAGRVAVDAAQWHTAELALSLSPERSHP